MRAPQTKTDVVAGLVWALVAMMLTILACIAWAVYYDKPIYKPQAHAGCPNHACCALPADPSKEK